MVVGLLGVHGQSCEGGRREDVPKGDEKGAGAFKEPATTQLHSGQRRKKKKRQAGRKGVIETGRREPQKKRAATATNSELVSAEHLGENTKTERHVTLAQRVQPRVSPSILPGTSGSQVLKP